MVSKLSVVKVIKVTEVAKQNFQNQYYNQIQVNFTYKSFWPRSYFKVCFYHQKQIIEDGQWLSEVKDLNRRFNALPPIDMGKKIKGNGAMAFTVD